VPGFCARPIRLAFLALFAIASTAPTLFTPLVLTLLALPALLLGNAFIVGINQIYDKPIDVINKPFLPVASGEISEKFAWVAVASSGLLGKSSKRSSHTSGPELRTRCEPRHTWGSHMRIGPLIVNRFFSPFLRNLYLLGWVLGAAYSVPPIRTKRSPILAAATIATVRGFLLNFGVYYAVKEAIGAPFVWNPKVTFIARFMTVFASVIAVTKDLPDTEGDAALNIPTLALKVGVKRVANVAVGVLFANYMVAVGVGLFGKAGAFNRPAMVVGHASLALWLGRNWKRVETDDIGSIKRFYKGIWDLFYCEYALYMII